MPQIVFVGHNGAEFEVFAKLGETLIEAAVRNSVSGIDADCGGACACATCHVYLSEDALNKLGEQGEMEASMLQFAESVRETSRLACQIVITDELDEAVLSVPEAQH